MYILYQIKSLGALDQIHNVSHSTVYKSGTGRQTIIKRPTVIFVLSSFHHSGEVREVGWQCEIQFNFIVSPYQ